MKLDDIFNQIASDFLGENSVKKEDLIKSMEIYEKNESYNNLINIINSYENEDGTIDFLLMIKNLKYFMENPNENNIYDLDIFDLNLSNDNSMNDIRNMFKNNTQTFMNVIDDVNNTEKTFMNDTENDVNNTEKTFMNDTENDDKFIQTCNLILSSDENMKMNKDIVNLMFNINNCNNNKNFSEYSKKIIESSCDENDEVDLKLICKEFIELYKNFG